MPARTPRAQARPRVPLTAGHANPPLRQRRDRPEIRPPLRLGDATQALGDPLRAVEVPFFEVGVDQKREQRAHHGRLADRGNLVILTLGGPLEQLPRTRRLAPGEVQGGERGNDVRMLLESLQQQRGLLQAALPDTQVREADDGGGAPCRHPQVEVPGGLDQLGLGLLPASGGCKDAAVVGAAEGGDDVAPLHALGSRAHPLVGARDVVDELARPQEPAEDLVNRGQLRRLACTGRCQRLVGQDQSLLDAIGHDEQATEICQCEKLDVGVAESASDHDRLAEQGLAHLRVRF